MTIRTFDDWAATRTQTYPLSVLKDLVVGIEAAYYLSKFLNAGLDPLLVATGGEPLASKKAIEEDLDKLMSFDVTPLFVFSGMDTVKKPGATGDLAETARFTAQARGWELCKQHDDTADPDRDFSREVAEAFRDSGPIKVERLFKFFQKILYDKGIDFIVAPYSAWAQLAYLEDSPKQYIDTIMGGSETFLFEVDKVITNIDVKNAQFSWISKRMCQEELGKVSGDMFVDACMLSGTSFLPTFPPLENSTNERKTFTIRDTVNMMFTLGKSVTAVCTHYQDEARVQQLDYLDRYQRGRLAVKHHVVLTDDGKVEPLDVDHAPWDVHEFIGQRLPEELYFYLSKGIISPRVLNWLTSGEMTETPPLDNGESAEYRELIQKQLSELRTQALALLSQPLSRFYQRKDVTVHYWFDSGLEKALSHKDLVPRPRDIVADWNVRQKALDEQRKKTGFLSSTEEILANTLWRFLHLRGYVDDDHTLTPLGIALQAAMSTLDPADHLEESIFLAVELLRLNALNAAHIFSDYVGAPVCGSEKDKFNCAFVSRVACLGHLRTKLNGFTGPLSHQLLAFHSIFSAVRDALRDLVEVVMVNLLLNADAGRDREDWVGLGLALPFATDYGCGLGIAVNMYLDEIDREPSPPPVNLRETIKIQDGEKWLPNSVDMPADLHKAFRLWDAVYQAVKTAGSGFEDGASWKEVDEWLKERR
ncbi:MAG: hypothetical protein M1833_006520 [Piccolia ochrophora]|nr:MAG: hypothetical protein M1833_006520 [Piccolia ochrophora]